MMKAGLENKSVGFLFVDTQVYKYFSLCLKNCTVPKIHSFYILQIKDESFLEDLNNILNAGDVPNIYQPDELDNIYTTMKPIVQDSGQPPTKANLYSAYTKLVRSNIHLVVCMR